MGALDIEDVEKEHYSNEENIKEVKAGRTTKLVLVNPIKEQILALGDLTMLTHLEITFIDNSKTYR